MTYFARWLWRRHRDHYVLAIVLTSTFGLVFGLVVPGILVGSLFANLTRTQSLVWALDAAAVSLIAAAIGVAFCSDTTGPVNAWARGQDADATDSWNAALSIPAVLAHSVAITEWLMHVIFSVPFVVIYAHLHVWEGLALGAGTTTLVVVGGFAYGNGVHVLLRPCIDEIAPYLPLDVRPVIRGWNLTGRLNVGVGSLTIVAALAVVGGTLVTRATMRDYVTALICSLVMTGVVILIYDLGLVRPTVSSVRDLLAATERVNNGDFTGRVPVTSIDEFGDLAVSFNKMQGAMRDREALRTAFGSYVNPVLAQRLLDQGDSVFAGEDVEVTVFFVDVRGFTSYAETASAPEAVARLNALFEILVPVIQDAGGHANHYLGDGLLAVFGTPNPLEDHADRAFGAALEIQRSVKARFGGDLHIGIGINTGPVIAGTIGGGGRLEFTVIGDTVNVASRVERMTRETGDGILLTQATIDSLTSVPCATQDRGEVQLRGKRQRVCVHAVVEPRRKRPAINQ